MFEWLANEIDLVKTNKFFLIDGPASPEFRFVVDQMGGAMPPSYRLFVVEFGNAKLYRKSSYWQLEIYAGPRESISDNGEELMQFGRTHTSLAYFKKSLLTKNSETPVFEWHTGQGLRKTASGFEEWLKAKCNWARKKYKQSEWKAIMQGPSPFTVEEKAILAARKQFRWRIVGISGNGDLKFEIHNGSKMVLPYLSVGIRGKHRPPNQGILNGGGRLPVASIIPGETKVIEYDCYKKYIKPEDVEVFDKPEPGPEDREEYWEFKKI